MDEFDGFDDRDEHDDGACLECGAASDQLCEPGCLWAMDDGSDDDEE